MVRTTSPNDWLRYFDPDEGDTDEMRNYILVDSASSKKKGSDHTVMVVIGLGADQNYYLLDAVRDRLNLSERCKELFRLHRKWRPERVGYEKYGMRPWKNAFAEDGGPTSIVRLW